MTDNAMYLPGASVAASRRLLSRLLGRRFPESDIAYHSVSQVLLNASEGDEDALRLIIDRLRRAPGKNSMPRSAIAREETAVHFSADFADSIMSTPDTSILAIHPSGRIIGVAHTEFSSDEVLEYNQNLLGLDSSEPVVEFGRLFVLSDYRGFGIADRLFARSVAEMMSKTKKAGMKMPPTFLIVECGNEDGIRFFSKYEDMNFIHKHCDENGDPHIVTFDDTDHYEMIVNAQMFNDMDEALSIFPRELHNHIVVSSEYDLLISVLDKNGFRQLRRPEEIREDDFFEDEIGQCVSAQSVDIQPVEGTVAHPVVSVNEGELMISSHAMMIVRDDNSGDIVPDRRADALHMSTLVAPYAPRTLNENEDGSEIVIQKLNTYEEALSARLYVESRGGELTRNISSVDVDGRPDSFRIVYRKSEGGEHFFREKREGPTYPVRYPVRRVSEDSIGQNRFYKITPKETGVSIIVNGYVIRL